MRGVSKLSSEVQLYVSDGRIPCPNRGNINLDICLYCEHLTEVELDSRTPFIRCTPPKVQGVNKVQTPHTLQRPQQPLQKKTSEDHVGQSLRELVLDTSRSNPDWGLGRIKNYLQTQTVYMSTRKIRQILQREGMLFRKNRINHLMSLAASGQVQLTQSQKELLESHDSCFRERGLIGSYPGQHLIQTAFQADEANSGMKIMIQVVIDTYSGYSFAFVHYDRPRLHAISLLQHYVLPFFNNLHLRIEEISTIKAPLFQSGREHSYGDYLRSLSISHHLLTRDAALVNRFSDRFWKPWIRQVSSKDLSELYNLQSYLVKSLETYNESIPMSDFPNLGQTPRQRIDLYLTRSSSLLTPRPR